MTQVLKLLSNVRLPKHSVSLTTALCHLSRKPKKEVFLFTLNAFPSSYPARFNHSNLKGKHIMQTVFSFLFGEVDAIFCRMESHRTCAVQRKEQFNSMLQYCFGCHSFCFVLNQHQVGVDEIWRFSFSSPHPGGLPVPRQTIFVPPCTSAQQTERGELD